MLPGLDGAAVLIANYHAPEEKNTEQIVEQLRKFGVENIRLQREVFNPELYFGLLVAANFGDLSRMTQFKAADEKTAQILTYPVLMTHDVAGFEQVFVGLDQQQHLEYAAKLLRRYNRRHGVDYVIPKAEIVVGRIKDLRDPEKKMSKSSPQGCLFLDDTPDEIRLKLRKAVMNEAGRDNLTFLHETFVGHVAPDSNQLLKEQLAEAMIERFR